MTTDVDDGGIVDGSVGKRLGSRIEIACLPAGHQVDVGSNYTIWPRREGTFLSCRQVCVKHRGFLTFFLISKLSSRKRCFSHPIILKFSKFVSSLT